MFRWTEAVAAIRTHRALGPLAACAGLLACAAAIVPLTVPKELSERTRLELSGITWSKVLSRYVVVSDDVGPGDKHAPLLFTITADGRMEGAPLPIVGVDELNDPESVTEVPDGTLFVATSHSLNKRGTVPKSRRRILHLAVTADRRSLELGEVDLTTARNPDGTVPWGAGPLDVEALAFRGGALYIGLKSPLSAAGAATLLRLPDAVKVVDSGAIPPGSVTVWSVARFSVVHDGTRIDEGISDLSFLADGTLLVVANSPKGMPSDGGGALWRLRAPNGVPELLRKFDGMKPEGVALAPDGRSAMIVFDTDGGKPRWLRWPLSP